MLSSTITWVSNKDLFNQIFKIPSYLIETPLIMNDLLIINYIRTPLYKGIVKHMIDVQGSEQAIIDFNYLVQNNFKVLTYTTRLIKVEEILGFTRQLQIALYQHGYKTDIIYYINGDNMTFVPMIKGENVYVEKMIDIDVDAFIGYKPLVDLYIDPVSLKIAASDLIYQCDLTPFDYIINKMPVVKVNGQTEQEVIATRAEFSMDKLLPIVSKIINLHDVKIKSDMINVNLNLDRIEAMAYLKYAAIRAYVDLYKDDHYKDIKVSSNMTVKLPVKNEDLINKIHEYVNVKRSDYFVHGYKTQKEAASNRAMMTLDNNGIYLTIPINNQYYVVGNRTPKKTNYEIYNTVEDGVYDITIDNKDIVGLMPRKNILPQE